MNIHLRKFSQVTFKRGTDFRITKVKEGKRKIIYMEEI